MINKKIILLAFAISAVMKCDTKEGKCYMPVNLLLALDASGSIEPESWQSGIGLSKRIIRSFPIVNGGNEFGILDFSTNPRVVLNLDESASKAIAALDALKSNFKDGHSFIDLALNKASALLESAKKTNRLNILVIITDGYMTLKNGKDYTSYIAPAKEKLAAAEAIVFAVGIGEYINDEALRFMASVPTSSHVFNVDDEERLIDKILEAAEIPCPVANDFDIACGGLLLQKLGCFRDKKTKPRPFSQLLFDDKRNKTKTCCGAALMSHWNKYITELVCRCASQTKQRGGHVFGLQFYGECWFTKNLESHNKDGPAKSKSNCRTFGYTPCNKDDRFCVGEAGYNAVYILLDPSFKKH